MPKKSQKMLQIFFCLKQTSKCDTCFYIHFSIFQGLFKNIVFRSVALVIKKLWAIFDFFLHTPDFLTPCTLPYALKKIIKNPLNFYSLTVKKNLVIKN